MTWARYRLESARAMSSWKGESRRSEASKRERDEEYAEMMASASAKEVKGPHCQRRNCGAFGRGLKGRGWRGTAKSRDSARVGSSRFAER